jgi:hypothetical protein
MCDCDIILSTGGSEQILSDCNNKCNFCKIGRTKSLFNILQTKSYHMIEKYMCWDYILSNIKILELLSESIIISNNIEKIRKILQTHKSLHQLYFSKTLESYKKYSYSKKYKFEQIIQLFVEHNTADMGLIIDMICDKYLREINRDRSLIRNGLLAESDMLKDIGSTPTFDILIKKYQNIKKTSDYMKSKHHIMLLKCYEKLMIEIINSQMNIWFTENVSYALKNIPAIIRIQDKLVCKFTNMYRYICITYIDYFTQPVMIKINPFNIICSLKSIPDIHNKLLSRGTLQVSYLIDGVAVDGYDAGGLTKEFYHILFDDIRKSMDIVDSYTIPSSNIDEMFWYSVGILIARAYLIDMVQINMNLHPLICYLISECGQLYKFDNLYTDIKKYQIEYIDGLNKLNLLTKNEFDEFLEVSDEKSTTLNKYLIQTLYQTYIKYRKSNIEYLVKGYLKMFERLCISNTLSLLNTHHIFCSMRVPDLYPISVQSPHSLICCLKVEPIEYTDFKNTFCDILNDIDIDKLKIFFKFWFGTSNISSFVDLHPKIVLCDYPTFGCFKSSTCSGTLYLNKSYTIKNTIIECINNSTTNQILAERSGMMMQLM